MKSRPILFSAPMIRALLAGTKTQTRRIIKPQPRPFVQHTPDRNPTNRTAPYIDAYCGERKTPENPRGMGRDWHWWTADNRCDPRPVARCPYGKPGDRLWVRETWCRLFPIDDKENERAYYRATDNAEVAAIEIDDGDGYMATTKSGKPVSPWKSPLHMFRMDSRITLEITGVRVERLHEISEEDAQAEGCAPEKLLAVDYYARLWESINGPGSWAANPWVWVVSFRRITDDAAMPANAKLSGPAVAETVD